MPRHNTLSTPTPLLARPRWIHTNALTLSSVEIRNLSHRQGCRTTNNTSQVQFRRWKLTPWCTSSVSFFDVVFHNLFPGLPSPNGVPDQLLCFAKHLQKRHINVASTQLQGLCLHAFYLTFASRHRNLAHRSGSRMRQRPENFRICWSQMWRVWDARKSTNVSAFKQLKKDITAQGVVASTVVTC